MSGLPYIHVILTIAVNVYCNVAPSKAIFFGNKFSLLAVTIEYTRV